MKDETTKQKERIRLRSEEVQEMMGEVPSWIIRWGITLIGVLLVGAAIGSYYFKYPDTLTADITIGPANAGTVPIGVGHLPAAGAGKVKTGQRVKVRLENYPDVEYGYVCGVVDSISPIPDAAHTYPLYIALPQGLRTNYGLQLPPTVQMMGTAEIVVKDKRLIENIIQPLKKILKDH